MTAPMTAHVGKIRRRHIFSKRPIVVRRVGSDNALPPRGFICKPKDPEPRDLDSGTVRCGSDAVVDHMNTLGLVRGNGDDKRPEAESTPIVD